MPQSLVVFTEGLDNGILVCQPLRDSKCEGENAASHLHLEYLAKTANCFLEPFDF